MIFNEINYNAIIINSIASPVLMLLILLTIRLPGVENTKRIYQRIVDIVDADPTFEQSVALITKSIRQQGSLLTFIFTIVYSLTFVVTLYLIYEALSLIQFNILSIGLFVFFISVISFFSYKIKQVANEYRLVRRDSIFSPIVDFFFMPILSLGKIFSEGVAQLNFFTIIFDFIIEAPFKLIIEVIEEWISFVRARKDEIV